MLFFGFPERVGQLFTRIIQSVMAEELMCHGKGLSHRSFRGYQSLRQVPNGQSLQIICEPAHKKLYQRHRGLLELCEAAPV